MPRESLTKSARSPVRCSRTSSPRALAPARRCITDDIQKEKTPTWTDLKAKLKDFDRAGLIGLVQDLYAANKDNQLFLHARFGLLDDALEPLQGRH